MPPPEVFTGGGRAGAADCHRRYLGTKALMAKFLEYRHHLTRRMPSCCFPKSEKPPLPSNGPV